MEIAIGMLVFVAVMMILALLFGAWVIVTIVRAIGSAITGPRSAPIPKVRLALPAMCPNVRCHAPNPGNAKFCRRCGQALQIGAPTVRQVA